MPAINQKSIPLSNDAVSNFLNYRNAAKALMVTSLVIAIATTILLTPMASIVPFAISATIVQVKAVAAITAAIFLIAAAILYKTKEKAVEKIIPQPSTLTSSSLSVNPLSSETNSTITTKTAKENFIKANNNLTQIQTASNKKIKDLERQLPRANKKRKEKIHEEIIAEKTQIETAEKEKTAARQIWESLKKSSKQVKNNPA